MLMRTALAGPTASSPMAMREKCEECWSKGRDLWKGSCFCSGDVVKFVAPYFGDNPMIDWKPVPKINSTKTKPKSKK